MSNFQANVRTVDDLEFGRFVVAQLFNLKYQGDNSALVVVSSLYAQIVLTRFGSLMHDALQGKNSYL